MFVFFRMNTKRVRGRRGWERGRELVVSRGAQVSGEEEEEKRGV